MGSVGKVQWGHLRAPLPPSLSPTPPPPHTLGCFEGKGSVDMVAARGLGSSPKVVILNFSELQLSPVK